MTVYIAILAVSSISAVLWQREKRRGLKNAYLALAFLSLFVPAAVRCGIGVDYANYLGLWNDIAQGKHVSQEPFFVLYVKALQAARLPFQSLIVLYALLTYLCIFFAVPEKYAGFAIPAYVLLCYLDSLNLIRQSLAGAIMLVAFRMFMEKKYVRYVILCAVAFLNHRTAAIGAVLLPLFLALPALSRRTGLIVFLAAGAATFLAKDAAVSFLMGTVLPRTPYAHYAQSAFASARPLGTLSTGLGVLLRAICLVTLFWLSQEKNIPERERKMSAGFLLYLLVTWELSSVLYILGRLQNAMLYAYVAVFISTGKSCLDGAGHPVLPVMDDIRAHDIRRMAKKLPFIMLSCVYLSYAVLFLHGLRGLGINEDLMTGGKQVYPYTHLWNWQENGILRERLGGMAE